jgi:glycogen(starch) synthase
LPFDRYVLGLGRLVHKKGFDLLITAFAEIAANHPDVGLVIAGDGPERQALALTAEALGIRDQVHFPGRLDRGSVAAVMRGAEVFVMPSRVEPFGIVVLEAWRAGVPVIATAHGGPAEFVTDRVSGLVVDPFDTRALAASLGSLLESRERRHALTKAACRELGRFSWMSIANEYEDLYIHTVDRSGAS